MSWAAVIVAGVGAAVKIGTGIAQKNKAKRMMKNLQEPDVPQEILDNKKLAETQAARGLPAEQYARAMKDIQRQQMMSIRSAQDRRAGIGTIATTQQLTNDANLDLNVADAQMKLANERNLMAIRNQVAGWKNRIKENKFNRDYNYSMSLQGAGNQNIASGVDQGIAGVGQGIAGGAFNGYGNTSNRRQARAGRTTYYNGYNSSSGYGDYLNEFNQ